jgi:hypothetical protein
MLNNLFSTRVKPSRLGVVLILIVILFVSLIVVGLRYLGTESQAAEDLLLRDYKLLPAPPSTKLHDFKVWHNRLGPQAFVGATYETTLDAGFLRRFYAKVLAKHGWVGCGHNRDLQVEYYGKGDTNALLMLGRLQTSQNYTIQLSRGYHACTTVSFP